MAYPETHPTPDGVCIGQRPKDPTDDGEVPDADAFPMLGIEYRVRGRSAHESARAILAAVRRDREGDQGAIAVEERRVAAARYLRSQDAHTDRSGRDGN